MVVGFSMIGAHVNNALLVLFVVTGLILVLFWREVVAAYRENQKKSGGGQKRGFARQISDHDEQMPEMTTQEDVEARFEADRMKQKGSLIRDMANRSPWKEGAPSPELARSMSDEIKEVDVEHVGKRTMPSREIEEVDRSDRPGEDLSLTDRVVANAAVQGAPKELQELLADEHVAKRRAKRDELSDAVESLDDILDD